MNREINRSLKLIKNVSTPKSNTSLRKSIIILDDTLNNKTPPLEYNEITNEDLDVLMNRNKSLILPQKDTPWQDSLDSLYNEFVVALYANTSNDILEVLLDFVRCCTDTLKIIQDSKSKSMITQSIDEQWLENERNTWRLMYVLYMDRLKNQENEEELGMPYCGRSERECTENLYRNESLVREAQLVIDWLERNTIERGLPILHQSDSTYGWEHTLHQLESPETIPMGSSTEIVTCLHPDVMQTEKRSLHHLDMASEKQLCQQIFAQIRCGNLEEAQELCNNCGHFWRAAIFEGWKLYHNVNDREPGDIENSNGIVQRRYEDIEGNYRRDLWKLTAWKFCKKNSNNVHERAALGALCGNLEAMLSVCNSWEDYLWAYVKTMVDIRVESEIRDNITRDYVKLPDEYWDQRMSLNQVFQHIESIQNRTVQIESQMPYHLIQKLIILDEIPQLIKYLNEMIKKPDVTTQFLRFSTHIVLFYINIRTDCQRSQYDEIIENYIQRLDEMSETELLAYYGSNLNSMKQIKFYSAHLEKIVDNEKRKLALQYGKDNGFQIYEITRQIVINIKNRTADINFQDGKTTAEDEFKISALDWLLFYEEQRLDALVQANSLIFMFLSLGKVDAAHLTLNKIPANTLELISDAGESMESSDVVKEYIGYKAYLNAQEAFFEWFKQFKGKPLPPPELPNDAQFVEKVAYQHRMSQHNAEIERWKLTVLDLAKTAKVLLYNVLLFPNGWLVAGENSDYLRSMCIPEVVLWLYTILFECGQLEECVQLADIVASEVYCLYKVYRKEKLEEFLDKICECSIALINDKKDPWGKEATV